MRPVLPFLTFTLILLATGPATGQASAEPPTALYMTDDDAQSLSDARALSPESPTGDALTLALTPAVEDETLVWASDAVTDDLTITGDVTADLYFDNGVDVNSMTTVTLGIAAPDGTITELASDSQNAPAETTAHTETFTLAAEGAVVPEGSSFTLTVQVTGEAAVVNLLYDGADAPSGLSEAPLAILDSDGDGVGDSAERRAGTDPDDASSTPSQGSSGDPGTGDDAGSGQGDQANDGPAQTDDGSATDDGAPVEAVLATFFLLLCLAIAGYATFERFST